MGGLGFTMTDPQENRGQRPTQVVGSVDKALAVMELLATERRPMGLAEISASLGLNMSTLHHILLTLKYRRFIEQDRETKRYLLGLRAFEVGLAAGEGLDIGQKAAPFLRQLTAETGESANLAILDGGDIVYVAQSVADRVMKTFTRLGARIPAHCTGVGKVLLADLPAEQVRIMAKASGLKRFTANTITDLEDLLKELCQVRQSGYAIDEEEREEGVVCVAAPVCDHTGQVKAAVSVSGPVGRIKAKEWSNLVALVKSTADALSANLGCPQGRAACTATEKERGD